MTQPSIFISHGSPMIVLESSPAQTAISEIGQQVSRPDAILVCSAHFETSRPVIGTSPTPATIHDFGPFDDRLFEMRYMAPGAPELAAEASKLLQAADFDVGNDDDTGLDHGVWTPLMLAFPEADIPVVPLSVQPSRNAAHHFALGEALAPLREKNVLLIGSGHITHNLRLVFGAMQGSDPNPGMQDMVEGFVSWMGKNLQSGAVENLLNWQDTAPNALFNHPTPEHLMPLFFALGAGGREANATLLHRSTQYHYLTSDIWKFG